MPTENRSSNTEQMVSVPDTYMLVERNIWTEQQVEAATTCITRLKAVPGMSDCDLAMAAIDAAQCKAPEVTLADLQPAAQHQSKPVACEHEWTDDGEFLLICTKCGAQENHDPGWRDMETAPRDGTMLRLLVRFDEHSTEDDQDAPTIGANNFDNDRNDEWLFAGWNWEQDYFTQGRGDVLGWLPMLDVPHADTGEVEWLQAEVKRLKGLQPDSPPRPPDGQGLPRYGLRWNGPQQPLAVPMDDGYWTPWHLAVSSLPSTPTSDGFSAEQMAAQGAGGYRNGIKAAAELAEAYPELAQAIRALPLLQ